MKIEKLSENQIRCTLNKTDLVSRELKISELAYGTEKSKSLFRDMLQQASYEFGFEAENIPLMIEAIPISADCIILVITKVDDPEELDTRFSKFSPSPDDEDIDFNNSDYMNLDLNDSSDVVDLIKKMSDDNIDSDKEEFVPLPESVSKSDSMHKAKVEKITPSKGAKPQSTRDLTPNIVKVYSFVNLDSVTNMSHVVSSLYKGENTLYKDGLSGKYYLLLLKSSHTPDEFNKICNIISEYGNKEKFAYATEAFFSEHYEVIINNNAIQILANI